MIVVIAAIVVHVETSGAAVVVDAAVADGMIVARDAAAAVDATTRTVSRIVSPKSTKSSAR